MDNQANFTKVVEKFLEPMAKLYSKALSPEIIQAYVIDLGDFSAKTLEHACVSIRRKNSYFPKINEAMAACKEASYVTEKQAPTQSIDQKNEWQVRNEKIERLVRDYLSDFTLNSPLWVEAVREGWDMSLRSYVYAVAEVQAQIIGGVSNVGWNGMTIFGSAQITDQARYHFMEDQRRQAATNHIDVPIPSGQIHAWRAAKVGVAA